MHRGLSGGSIKSDFTATDCGHRSKRAYVGVVGKKVDAAVDKIKTKIKSLKALRQAALEAKDKKMATIYRRQISRLKKKTRRKAA